jgi:hypothetical protein
MTVTVKINGNLLKGKSLGIVRRACMMTVNRILLDLYNETVKMITKLHLVSSGAYRGSVVRRAARMAFRTIEGEIRTMSPYADVIEKGREPGKFPPPDAIELWARRKGLPLKRGTSPKARAFLLSRAIARKGTIKRFGHKGAQTFARVKRENEVVVKKRFERDLPVLIARELNR